MKYKYGDVLDVTHEKVRPYRARVIDTNEVYNEYFIRVMNNSNPKRHENDILPGSHWMNATYLDNYGKKVNKD